MPPPFFSILLPTKNRSLIVGDAIQSVLRQTCGDFELIISDNDDSDTATRAEVARFSDERVRYFRTSGKLPMHGNWENALQQARGRHVLILEDKMRLVGNALEILQHHLRTQGDMVISYEVKFEKEATMPDPKGIPPARQLKCMEVAERFCRFDPEVFGILPKSLDSCSPREVIDRAKGASSTGLFYSYVTPDYSSGFQLLSAVDELLYIRQPLVYIPNNWMWQGKFSVGQSTYKKEALTARWLEELPVSTEEIQRNVPVKTKWLWLNNVLYDFRTHYRRPGHQPEIDWVCYHALCYMIVLTGLRLKADMSSDRAAIRESMRQRSLAFKARVLVDVARRVLKLAGTMARKQLFD